MPEHEVIVTFVFRVTDPNPVAATQHAMQYFTSEVPLVTPVEQNTRVITRGTRDAIRDVLSGQAFAPDSSGPHNIIP